MLALVPVYRVTKIVIGNEPSGKPVKIDLGELLVSNILMAANSGGGKSWALRRLIEQVAPHIPVIVIDPEGEFGTLRQKHDTFVYAAVRGGDTPITVNSAHLLARRVLELRASIVCDLYDLPKPQQKEWAARFFRTIVDAPKDLWHDVLVAIDEAHEFVPEPGRGRGELSVATGPLIELAAKGRKRGKGVAAASQRPSKVHTDFRAELKNSMMGLAWLDIDRERAVEQLGIGKSERPEFMAKLKTVEPGHFWALGRAISTEVVYFKTGEVHTEHPRRGKRQSAPPPPSGKVLHLLPQLADLPKEAETQARSEAELRGEIAKLKRELAAKPVAPAAPAVKAVEKPAISEADFKRIERLEQRLKETLATTADRSAQAQQAVLSELGNLVTAARGARTSIVVKARLEPPRPASQPRPAPVSNGVHQDAPGDLAKGERLCLIAVAQQPDGATREQVTIITGYKRSTRDAYLQRLGIAGHVEIRGEKVYATDSGVAALGSDYEPLPTGAKLLEHHLRRLPEGERKVLEVVAAAYPQAVEREVLTETTGYKRSTRDAYVQRLGVRRLVQTSSDGVRASRELFD